MACSSHPATIQHRSAWQSSRSATIPPNPVRYTPADTIPPHAFPALHMVPAWPLARRAARGRGPCGAGDLALQAGRTFLRPAITFPPICAEHPSPGTRSARWRPAGSLFDAPARAALPGDASCTQIMRVGPRPSGPTRFIHRPRTRGPARGDGDGIHQEILARQESVR